MHAPYLPTTHHLLKAEHFQAMRDDTVFINSARGGCIDEQALIADVAEAAHVDDEDQSASGLLRDLEFSAEADGQDPGWTMRRYAGRKTRAVSAESGGFWWAPCGDAFGRAFGLVRCSDGRALHCGVDQD